MSPSPSQSDITVRGRTINVPNSTEPTHPPRHQPNTPINKKKLTPKPDHIPYTPDPDPPTTEPKETPAAPPDPPALEPDGDKNNVPAPTS